MNALVEGRDPKLVPIVDVLRPRVVSLDVPMDISTHAVERAWDVLRQMASARGFPLAQIENTILYVAAPCEIQAKRVAEAVKINSVVIVPPEMLITYYTWVLKFGLDSVLVSPAN